MRVGWTAVLSIGSLLLIGPAGGPAFAQSGPVSYFSVPPCRLLDTRLPGQGPALASGVPRLVAANGGTCGIPAIARAIAANVTSIAPTGGGNLKLYPGGGTVPPTSALNFSAGQTRANNGVFQLAVNGTSTLAILATVGGSGTVDVVLDVTGYFSVYAECTDADHDGYFAQGCPAAVVDCNDANPAVHPGALEVCGDGLDNDCNGVVDGGCSAAGRYVSAAIGNDANPGTAAAPFKTIAKGIAGAMALGGAQAVLVAEGSYPEKVTLVEGISLVGGHHCTTQVCTWARDPLLYDTVIVDQDFEGVLAPNTITRYTRLDGFRVLGMGGVPAPASGSAALTVKGGSPVIMGSRILGGALTGGVSGSDRSIGIAIVAPAPGAAGPLIYGNDIRGGASSGSTSAILFDPGPPPGSPTIPAAIVTNTIRGGNGLNTDGITAIASGAGTLIAGNDILAGTAAAGGAAWGISVFGTATIDANRINVDQANVGTCSGTVLCGGIHSLSATAIVTNNVVLGVKARMSVAVLLEETGKPAGAVRLNANYLDGGGEGVTAFPSTSVAVELLTGCNTCGNSVIAWTIYNNVLLGGQNQGRYGVYETLVANGANQPHPTALYNNDFTFAVAAGRTDVVYHLWTPLYFIDFTTVDALNQQTFIFPHGANFSADPQVDATFHLTAGSACIDAGTNTEAPTADMDGEPRPQGGGFDVGPDERTP